MALKKLAVAVMVFVIFSGGAFAAYQVANEGKDAAAATDQRVTNETISQQVGIWQLVGKATEDSTAGFGDDNVTVYNENGTELERGHDYRWNASDGAIYFNDTADTTDGENASVSYNYERNTQEVQEVDGPLSTITGAIGNVAFLAGGIALAVLLLAFAGFFAKNFGGSGPSTNR